MTTNLYTDGSSPLLSCYPSAYCIFKEDKLIYTKVLDENIPAQDCEYLALIEALNLIKEEIVTDTEIIINSDCGFMLDELNFKRSPINPKLFEKARKLLNELKHITLHRVHRTKNIAGFYLERRLFRLRDEEKFVMKIKPNPQLKKIRRKFIYKK